MFANKGFFMHTLIAKALAVGFAASMAVTGSTTRLTSVGQALQTPNTGIFAAALYATPSLEQKSPLDRWIEKLVYLESEGKERFKVLDHNGYYSYGCLQFQMGTFEAYGSRYGLLAPVDDLDTLIYDCGLQKTIAKRMIEEDPGNWRHWYTSVMTKKLGFPPKENEPAILSLRS